MVKKKQSFEDFKKSTEKSLARETLERSFGPQYRDVKSFVGKKAKLSNIKSGKKATAKRATGERSLLSAFGVVKGGTRQAGAGRPRGSYKYYVGGKPVPIQVYNKYKSQQRTLYQQFQDAKVGRLSGRGFSPEQIRQLEFQRASTSPEVYAPTILTKKQQVAQVMNEADDDLEFRRFMAKSSLSPNTQKILLRLRQVQNKGKLDNIEHSRRTEERRLVGRSMNMMKAHENMTKVRMDFTGVNPEENILMAENVFKENPENNILRPKRLNLLNTREAGNDLRF